MRRQVITSVIGLVPVLVFILGPGELWVRILLAVLSVPVMLLLFWVFISVRLRHAVGKIRQTAEAEAAKEAAAGRKVKATPWYQGGFKDHPTSTDGVRCTVSTVPRGTGFWEVSAYPYVGFLGIVRGSWATIRDRQKRPTTCIATSIEQAEAAHTAFAAYIWTHDVPSWYAKILHPYPEWSPAQRYKLEYAYVPAEVQKALRLHDPTLYESPAATAQRVFRTEISDGLHDRVVVGGLARFVEKFAQRSADMAGDDGLHPLAVQLEALLENYANLDHDERAERLTRAVDLVSVFESRAAPIPTEELPTNVDLMSALKASLEAAKAAQKPSSDENQAG